MRLSCRSPATTAEAGWPVNCAIRVSRDGHAVPGRTVRLDRANSATWASLSTRTNDSPLSSAIRSASRTAALRACAALIGAISDRSWAKRRSGFEAAVDCLELPVNRFEAPVASKRRSQVGERGQW